MIKPDPSKPPPAVRLFGREQAYFTAIWTVVVFNLGVIFLGTALLRVVLPDDNQPLYWLTEFGVFGLSGMSIVGTLLHLFNKRPWIARWAFLLCCLAVIGTIIPFLVGGSVSATGRLGIILLLLTGGFVAFSMHVDHGGKKAVFRTKTQKMMQEEA